MNSYKRLYNILLEKSDDSDKGIVRWRSTRPGQPLTSKELKALIDRIKASSDAKKAAKKSQPTQGLLFQG